MTNAEDANVEDANGEDANGEDDRALVARLNRGELEAFDVLYERYRDWVFAAAWRFTQHHDDALDVLQETFSYFLSKFPGFELRAKLTTFLYPAVRNLSVASQRKRRRHTGDLDEAFGVVAPPELTSHLHPDLATVLRSLTEQQREVVLLRVLDEFALEEIAQVLGIPVGTVKSRLHGAFAALRDSPAARRYLRED